MEDLFGFMAFMVALLGLVFVLFENAPEETEYKIYNECYQIENKYYCK